jgi:hypothetical protein
MKKLTCLLLGAMPLASWAHTGHGADTAALHILHHGSSTLLLSLSLLATSCWLLSRSRRRR